MANDVDSLKARIIGNPFVDRVRIEMRVDEPAYVELCSLLEELAAALKPLSVIDKELALVLYSMPQMIRNAAASFDGRSPKPDIADRLEDQWHELDALVTECLSDG